MDRKHKPLVSYAKPSQNVLVEDTYQNLARRRPPVEFQTKYNALYPDACARQQAAGEWLRPKLEKKLCEELHTDPPMYARFLEGDPAAYQTLRPVILKYLDYPEDKLSPLLRHEKPGKPVQKAPRWLDKELTEKFLSGRGGKSSISPATWRRFQKGTHAPADDTLKALAELLDLDEAEAAHLKQIVRKDDIDDLTRIRPEVRRCWIKWKARKKREYGGPDDYWDSLGVFWDEAVVSPKAMTAFGCGVPEGTPDSALPDKSSQGTLLKLTIAFRLSASRAGSFMALADSGFYTMRDTVFLTCLTLELYQVEEISAILNFYAGDPEAPRLENPYLERMTE